MAPGYSSMLKRPEARQLTPAFANLSLSVDPRHRHRDVVIDARSGRNDVHRYAHGVSCGGVKGEILREFLLPFENLILVLGSGSLVCLEPLCVVGGRLHWIA